MNHQGTAPTKFLIGNEIEDLRDRVSLSPSVLAETLDMVYSTPQSVSKTLIEGKKQNVYTYKSRDGNEASFISLSDVVDIPTILRTAKDIADYADKNGTMKETPEGHIAEIEINDYLKHLGYTPAPDGGYKTKDKRKVWHDLKQVFNTPVKRAVRFRSGDKHKVLVFQAPIIYSAEIYPDGDTKRVIASDNPPKSFLIGIVAEVAKQMTGFKDSGLYFHKNLIAEPRRKAVDYKYDLTGYKQAVSAKLFLLLKQKVAPTRRYSVKQLTEVIGGRKKDRRKKLVIALNLLEKKGEIVIWGFANSRNKSYNKTEKKSTLVWVDHTDTAVYLEYQRFYKSKKTDTAKMREDIKRLKKDTKHNTRKIKSIEKDL